MGLIERFDVGRGAEAITHFRFATETIHFSSTRWEEVQVSKRILICFELSSGLKINLAKSMF